MWRPTEDLETFNRLLIKLEQAYLAVVRGNGSAAELVQSAELVALFECIDQNPYQAVLMSRIKTGHTMTPRHGINVLLLARAWARCCHRLGDRLDALCHASLLHDLGHWRPDTLAYVFEMFSREEYATMQAHTTAALEELPLSEEARTWIAQHHEQPDGRGYPNGITDPHPLAQLIRLCDIYDALTTPRRFRPAYTSHVTMTMMSRWAGYKYTKGLFHSFFQFMGGSHPLGGFVRLPNGAMAAMLPPQENQPMLLPLTNEQGDSLADPEPRLVGEEHLEEGYQWQQVPLPEPWRNLRPDLLNLPRFY